MYDPNQDPAPIAFANKMSETLKKDKKLKAVTRDFTAGKAPFDTWVDIFFEALEGTYAGVDYREKITDIINILKDYGYTMEQDGGFLNTMMGVANE